MRLWLNTGKCGFSDGGAMRTTGGTVEEIPTIIHRTEN
jgi:hypothetical protein